jgi:multiple sugar transport system substrate-binding protein
MRVDVYERIMRMQASRRSVLKGAAGMGAAAFGSTAIGSYMSRAWAAEAMSKAAQDALAKLSPDEIALRKEIVKVPGVGKGSPTDADWQKVGEMCLGATKASVKQGEFKGVELTFMGLNNQNLHDFLFRGFLKPWEAYTGAKINWIDLAQADYNPRLQQAIATGTVDFDMLEMGAPFEGDVCGKGLTSVMPDWVKQQIDYDDYVAYLKPPVGTWDGKPYRITIDGDCHNFNYRTDVFADQGLAKAWKDAGNSSEWKVPRTWQEVQAVTKFLKGKKINGQDVYGYLDAPKPWGGFGFYFLEDRATAYAKHPDDPAWLFDVDTMKPRVNNPAWVRAIQDVIDALPSEPPNQINADPNETAFSEFFGGTGSMVTWWGDVGQGANTSDTSVIGDIVSFDILPGSDDVYNSKAGKWEKLASGPNFAPNCAYLGWGVYVMKRVDSDSKKQKAAWSAAAHLGGKDLSLWTVMYPSGFQVHRQSHFIMPEWYGAGYKESYITPYLNSQLTTYNHPNRTVEPRIPGIFQYYSLAEDILANIFAGKMKAQDGADAIAAAWEKLTDQLGRDQQVKLYKASLGM